MKKILVIEDHTPMRVNLIELLEMNGYEVIPAADGKTGIELVHTKKPDLILCDVIMPQTNGYEVYSAVKQNQVTAHIPFVFMTGDTFFDHSNYKQEHHYLTKPFGHQELLDTIRLKLEGHKVEHNQDRSRIEHTEVLEYILNSISHEMRNPICSTLGLASLLELQTRKRNPDEIKKIVEGIKANAGRLNEITGVITDVLHKAIENYRNTKTL